MSKDSASRLLFYSNTSTLLRDSLVFAHKAGSSAPLWLVSREDVHQVPDATHR